MPKDATAKTDILKQKMRREYLDILHMEIEDTYDHREKLALLNKYIPLLYEELKNSKVESEHLTIVSHLTLALKRKLKIVTDSQDRKQVYQEVRKLLSDELDL